MSHPRRFFVDTSVPVFVGSILKLSQPDSHHLNDVLRAKIGQQVTVVNNHDHCSYGCVLVNQEKTVAVKVITILEDKPAINGVSALLFPLCKGKKNDFVCEKATELGVDQIVFFQAARSVVRLKTRQDQIKRLSRWEAIAKTAAAQSGKNVCPKILFYESLAESIYNHLNKELRETQLLCAALAPNSKRLKDIISPGIKSTLLIGPEGDLTEEELSLSTETGFELVSLGPSTLKSETAAIAGVALIGALWETP